MLSNDSKLFGFDVVLLSLSPLFLRLIIKLFCGRRYKIFPSFFWSFKCSKFVEFVNILSSSEYQKFSLIIAILAKYVLLKNEIYPQTNLSEEESISHDKGFVKLISN